MTPVSFTSNHSASNPSAKMFSRTTCQEQIDQLMLSLQRFDHINPFFDFHPFEDVKDESIHEANAEQWKCELDAIHRRVDELDNGDIERLAALARNTFGKNLSVEDVDTLEWTMYTMSSMKMLRLRLDGRRNAVATYAARLCWERSLRDCWTSYVGLKRDLEGLVTLSTRASPSSASDTVAEVTSAPQATFLSARAEFLLVRSKTTLKQQCVRAGGRLDELMNLSRVPDAFLDEQDKLENLIASLEDRLQDFSTEWRSRCCRSSSSSRSSTSSSRSTSRIPVATKRLDQYVANQNSKSDVNEPRRSNFSSSSRSTSRSSSCSFSRIPVAKHRLTQYVANPKSRLDIEVGKIVNRLNIPVHIRYAAAKATATATTSTPDDARSDSTGSARSVRKMEEWNDESGRYWVGQTNPKLCLCRILRSQQVMVRVGGGWQELSKYIIKNFGHSAATSEDGASRSPSVRSISSASNGARRVSPVVTPNRPLAMSPSTSPLPSGSIKADLNSWLRRPGPLSSRSPSFASTSRLPSTSSIQ